MPDPDDKDKIEVVNKAKKVVESVVKPTGMPPVPTPEATGSKEENDAEDKKNDKGNKVEPTKTAAEEPKKKELGKTGAWLDRSQAMADAGYDAVKTGVEESKIIKGAVYLAGKIPGVQSATAAVKGVAGLIQKGEELREKAVDMAGEMGKEVIKGGGDLRRAVIGGAQNAAMAGVKKGGEYLKETIKEAITGKKKDAKELTSAMDTHQTVMNQLSKQDSAVYKSFIPVKEQIAMLRAKKEPNENADNAPSASPITPTK